MADGVEIDMSELLKLATDLGEVPKNAGPNIRSAFEVTSVKVKKDASQTVSASKTWKAAASKINYDIKTDGHTIESEIGYEKEGAGKLGNLREFGGKDATNHLAPHNDLMNALQKETPDFQNGLEKALSDAERKAGL